MFYNKIKQTDHNSFNLHIGVATSFFNDKNRNLIRDLVELIIETKQELPTWLEGMAMEMKHQSGGLNRRGGRGGGGYVLFYLLSSYYQI